jgi:hypothetical protein
MRRGELRPQRPYRLPTPGLRIAGAVLAAMAYGLLYLGWPYFAARVLGTYGLPFPYALPTVLLLGLGLTALAVARSLAKPTRAYGPVSVAYDAAVIAYLAWLATQATVSLAYSGIGITFTFTDVLWILMVLPAVRLIADLLTTAEDATRPAERYAFDYPA